MTQTMQPYSSVLINELIIHKPKPKPEDEDNSRLLLSVFDSLNTLCEKLNRLDYLVRRKNIEFILSQKGKGERN